MEHGRKKTGAPAVIELHRCVFQQLMAVEQQRHALDVHVAALRVRREHAGDCAVRYLLRTVGAIKVERRQGVGRGVGAGLL